MIKLDAQLFAKGGSGSDGLGAYKRTTKEAIASASGSRSHGSAGGSGLGAAGGYALTARKEDDNHVSSIKAKETYELYRVSEKGEKLYDTSDGKEAKYELQGYKYDDRTGLWKDRYGKTYRVKRVTKK